jgi:hypothetical protein
MEPIRLRGAALRPRRLPMRALALGVAVAVVATSLSAQTPSPVFKGRPALKTTESGLEHTQQQVPAEGAAESQCLITQVRDSYFWASRNNLQLARFEAGGYVTYIAMNGAGYVRILKPEAKAAAALLGGPEARFDYVEHLMIGLRSVTYYGLRQ